MNKSKPLLSGLVLAAMIIVWSAANHYSTANTFQAALMCISLPIVLALTIIFLTRHCHTITFGNAVLPTLLTGLTASAGVGLSYFLYTVTNPEYIVAAQTAATNKWQQLNYTAIASQNQIENTPRFTNSAAWGGTLFLFHLTLYLVTATVTLSIMFFQRHTRNNRPHHIGAHIAE